MSLFDKQHLGEFLILPPGLNERFRKVVSSGIQKSASQYEERIQRTALVGR